MPDGADEFLRKWGGGGTATEEPAAPTAESFLAKHDAPTAESFLAKHDATPGLKSVVLSPHAAVPDSQVEQPDDEEPAGQEHLDLVRKAAGMSPSSGKYLGLSQEPWERQETFRRIEAATGPIRTRGEARRAAPRLKDALDVRKAQAIDEQEFAGMELPRRRDASGREVAPTPHPYTPDEARARIASWERRVERQPVTLDQLLRGLTLGAGGVSERPEMREATARHGDELLPQIARMAGSLKTMGAFPGGPVTQGALAGAAEDVIAGSDRPERTIGNAVFMRVAGALGVRGIPQTLAFPVAGAVSRLSTGVDPASGREAVVDLATGAVFDLLGLGRAVPEAFRARARARVAEAAAKGETVGDVVESLKNEAQAAPAAPEAPKVAPDVIPSTTPAPERPVEAETASTKPVEPAVGEYLKTVEAAPTTPEAKAPEEFVATGRASGAPPVEGMDALERLREMAKGGSRVTTKPGKSLVEFVRKMGGINADEVGALSGEMEMLGRKGSGTSGLLRRDGGGLSAEGMLQSVRESQYEIPEHWGPKEFLNALYHEATGLEAPTYSPETTDREALADADFRRRSEEEQARYEEWERQGMQGEADAQDVTFEFGAEARDHGITPKEVSDAADRILADEGFTLSEAPPGGRAGRDGPKAGGEAPGETTSIKNAAVEEERAGRGLPMVEKAGRKSDESLLAEAQAAFKANPRVGYDTVERLAKGGPHSDLDAAVLDVHKTDLYNARDAADAKGIEAAERGDAAAAAEFRDLAAKREAELSEADVATVGSGTETGRALRARQIALARDYSLAGIERKVRRQQDYKPLTEGERAEIKTLAERIKALEGERDAQKARIAAQDAELAIARMAGEKAKSRGAPGKGASNKVFTRDRYEAARKALRERLGGTTLSANAFLDPAIYRSLVDIAGFHIERGARSFAEWAAKVKEDAGEKWDLIAPRLREAWDEAGKEFNDKGIAEITAETRDAVKAGKSLDEIGSAGKLAELFIRTGTHGRENVAEAVHEVLKSIDPSITRSQTNRAIADYGKTVEMNKDPVKVELRDIKAQLVQIERLRDMAEGKAPGKQGLQRDAQSDALRELTRLVNEAKKKGGFVESNPERELKSALASFKTRMRNDITDRRREMAAGRKDVETRTPLALDAEAKALKAEHDQVVKDYNEVFGKPGLTDAQRTELAIKAGERSIKELERRAAAGDVFPERMTAEQKAEAEAKMDPRLKAVRERQKAMRTLVADMREAARPREAKSIKDSIALEKRLKKRLAGLTKQVETGELAKKREPREVFRTKEAVETEAKIATAKRAVDEMAARKALEGETRRAKITRVAFKEIPSLVRVWNIAFDLGATGIQGGLRLLSHPLQTGRAFGRGVSALRSESRKAVEDARITTDPMYERLRRDKVAFTGLEPGKMVDETVRSQWSDKIPVLKQLNRFTSVFLNNIRMDAAKALSATLSRTGDPTPKEAAAIAKGVNILTGRGTLDSRLLESGLDASANNFFGFLAPRWVLSRFQAALGAPMWGGSARTRKAFAMEYVRAATSVGVVIALARAFGKEVDEYGTLHLGNTHIDLTAGLGQAWKFMHRSAVALSTDDEAKKEQSKEFVEQFLRQKAAPIPGAFLSRAHGKTIDRQDATWANIGKDAAVPLTYKNFRDAIREQGLPEGVVLGVLSMVGARINHYDRDEKPSKRRR